MRYLVDANLIRYIAGKDPGWENIVDHITRVGLHNCGFSAVIFYELHVAADNERIKPEQRKALKKLAAEFTTLDFDGIAAIHAANIKAERNRHQKPTTKDTVDVMLAGHARAIGAAVATHNVKDFARVPGLAVEDWMQPLAP